MATCRGRRKRPAPPQRRVTNLSFESDGYSEFIAGFITGEITAQGFFSASLQLTVGDSLNLALGIGGGYQLTTTATLLDYTISTAVDKAGEVELMARTNGVFTVTLSSV